MFITLPLNNKQLVYNQQKKIASRFYVGWVNIKRFRMMPDVKNKFSDKSVPLFVFFRPKM